LWALVPRITEAVDADPVFAAQFLAGPLTAIRERFGSDAMPNEGEYTRRDPDGKISIVLPVSNVSWGFNAPPEIEELSDEMLEAVSAGAPAYGPAPPLTVPST
jgi:hypothetical protein